MNHLEHLELQGTAYKQKLLVAVLPCQTKIQLFIMYSLLYGLSLALCLCQLPLVYPFLSFSGLDNHISALRSWMFITSGPHQPAQWSLFTHTIPFLLTRTHIIIAYVLPNVSLFPTLLCLISFFPQGVCLLTGWARLLPGLHPSDSPYTCNSFLIKLPHLHPAKKTGSFCHLYDLHQPIVKPSVLTAWHTKLCLTCLSLLLSYVPRSFEMYFACSATHS